MLCSEQSLENERGDIAVSLRCKRWSCEICWPFNSLALKSRIIDGAPDVFITLTTNPRRLHSPDARAKSLVTSWRTICRRARKRFGFPHVPFIAIFEATKRGEPHLHIFARGCFIPHQWLSSQMSALIGAPVVHIRKVVDPRIAASYAAKNPYRFQGTKRFWTSQGWSLSRERLPVAERWSRRLCSLDEIERLWSASGNPGLRRRNRLTRNVNDRDLRLHLF
jgi:hypothetical protein